MTCGTLAGAAVALAVVAGVLFAGVCVTEFGYAADHPYRYGPAKVLATAAGAGALLSAAVAALAVAYARGGRGIS